jgi:CBS domain containing-hemolysin-like protein
MKTVAEVMNREMLYLAEDARPQLAREPILQFGVTGVPVLDERGYPTGFVSLRDLFTHGEAPQASAPVFTVSANTPVETAAWELGATDHHQAVVVDEIGRAVGVVSAIDLLRELVGVPPHHPAAFPAFRRAGVAPAKRDASMDAPER